MNSRQRRAAYRAMPQAGEDFHYVRGGFVAVPAQAEGPAPQGFNRLCGAQRGMMPSTSYVRARLYAPGDAPGQPTGGLIFPHVSRVQRAAHRAA